MPLCALSRIRWMLHAQKLGLPLHCWACSSGMHPTAHTPHASDSEDLANEHVAYLMQTGRGWQGAG